MRDEKGRFLKGSKFGKGHKMGIPHSDATKLNISKALKGKPTNRVPKSAFKKGHTPWSKGIKTGIVPKTTFKKGNVPFNKGTRVKKYCVVCNKLINNTNTTYCSQNCLKADPHRIIWNKGLTSKNDKRVLQLSIKQIKYNLDLNKIINLIEQKHTVKEIASIMCCSVGCLCSFAKRHNIKFNDNISQHKKPHLIERARAKRMKQVFHKSGHLTYLEKEIKRILDGFNIKYTMQKNIDNRTLVDFFVEPNICIYADGDYWHNKPITIDRDIRINSYLIDKGYQVNRYSEKEINKGIEKNILRITGDNYYGST